MGAALANGVFYHPPGCDDRSGRAGSRLAAQLARPLPHAGVGDRARGSAMSAASFRAMSARPETRRKSSPMGSGLTAIVSSTISARTIVRRPVSSTRPSSRRPPTPSCFTPSQRTRLGARSPSGVGRLSRIDGKRDGSAFRAAVMRSVHKFSRPCENSG
jgi:hypothetical protein